MSETSNASVETIPDSQMTSVSKELFFEGMPLPISIYLRMRAGSYLVIGRKGDNAKFGEMHSFHHPDFKIFVKALEHSQLINYVTDFTGRVVTEEKVSSALKGKFLSGLTEDALKAFDGKNFTSATQLHKISRMMMELCESSTSFSQIAQVLEQLPRQNRNMLWPPALSVLPFAKKWPSTIRSLKKRLL